MLLAFLLSQSHVCLQGDSFPVQPIECCLVLEIGNWENRLSHLGVAHSLLCVFKLLS